MATVSKTLGPGKDYENMAALMLANQDLVAAGDSWVVDCDAFEDTSGGGGTWAGWTLGPANTITIRGPAVPATPGSIDTNGYRWIPVGTAMTFGNVGTGGIIKLQYIQIETKAASRFIFVDGYDGGLATRVNLIAEYCTFITQGAQVFLNTRTNDGIHITFRNCACVGYLNAAAVIGAYNGGAHEFYNTIVIATYPGTAYGIQGHANVSCINCYVGKPAANGYCYSGPTLDTCAASDATGTAGLDNIAYDTSLFVSVTDDAEDFHLVASTALEAAGSVVADVPLDWDYGTRDLANPDVGVDEIDVAPGTPPWMGGGGGTGSSSPPYFSPTEAPTEFAGQMMNDIYVEGSQSPISSDIFDWLDGGI